MLFPHTYQVRDFAPGLAASHSRILVSDVIAHRVENGALTLVRQLFQGKMSADVQFAGDAPYFASIQAGGAFRAENAARKSDAAAAVEVTSSLNPTAAADPHQTRSNVFANHSAPSIS